MRFSCLIRQAFLFFPSVCPWSSSFLWGVPVLCNAVITAAPWGKMLGLCVAPGPLCLLGSFFFTSASNLPEGKAPRLQCQPLSSRRGGTGRHGWSSSVVLSGSIESCEWHKTRMPVIPDRHLRTTNSFHDISLKYRHAALPHNQKCADYRG